MTTGIDVQPPYILMAHSYGGIIVRAFLALYPDPSVVAGLILADTAEEVFYPMFSKDMNTAMPPMIVGLDLNEVMHYREKSQLTDAEYLRAAEGTDRCGAAAGAEDNHISARWLALHHQFAAQTLGDRPLSVIRCNFAVDLRAQYEAVVKAGNGTEEQRRRARNLIHRFDLYAESIQGNQLRLSRNSRYVEVADLGHACHLFDRSSWSTS
jgi:pimeloyl-ACP methyl ester carboxylesterase